MWEQPWKSFALQIWDIFTLDWKHLLLTGNNWVGKSTLLSALDLSFQRNRKYQRGQLWVSSNPYSSFADHFSWHSRRISGESTGDEREDISDDNILEAIEHSLFWYFGWNMQNLFLSGISTSTRANLLWALNDYISWESWVRKMRQHTGDESDVFEIAQDSFINALGLFAKKYKIPLDKLYGGVLLMLKWAFPYIKTEVTEWGYIVPQTKTLSQLAKVKVITLLDGQTSPLSLWERNRGLVDSIPKDWALILLDGPTNWLDPTNKKVYRNKILGIVWSQIVAASHDEMLIEAASEDPNWHVIELPLKTK